MRVWDVASGQQIGRNLNPNPTEAFGTTERSVDFPFGAKALAFSADSSTLTTVGRWTVRQWEVDSGEMLSDVLMPGVGTYAQHSVEGFRLIADSLAAGIEPGGGATIFDVTTGAIAGDTIDTQLDSTDLSLDVVAASPDGSTLVTAGADALALWSRDGRQLLARSLPRGDADGATFNATGELLVTSELFERPLAWNLSVEPPTSTEFSRTGANGAYTYYLDGGRVLLTHGLPQDRFVADFDVLDPETHVDLDVTFAQPERMFLSGRRPPRARTTRVGRRDLGPQNRRLHCRSPNREDRWLYTRRLTRCRHDRARCCRRLRYRDLGPGRRPDRRRRSADHVRRLQPGWTTLAHVGRNGNDRTTRPDDLRGRSDKTS